MQRENNIKEMEYLAGLLNKEANYFIAQYYKEKNFRKYLFYLRIAAALKSIEAIYELGIYYFNIKENEIAIVLLEEVSKTNYRRDYCLLNLGLAYYYMKQNQKATDILEKCENEKAYYILGKIYEYGEGRMVDLCKEKEYYKKSSDLGNQKAKTKYIKIETRLKEKERINSTRTGNYSSSSNYSSYSSSSSTSSSGCFITTAVCKTLEKEDDCDELIKFKEVRDSYIINQKNGEDLVEEYYRVAPMIIDRIEETFNSEEIYKYLWVKYLEKCYNFILKGEYKNMMKKYVEMVEYLKSEYLIDN